MHHGKIVLLCGSCVSALLVLMTPTGAVGQGVIQGGAISAAAPTGSVRLQPPIRGTEAPGVDVPLGGSNEPAIAINPLDPNNIVIASLWEARISSDGGATWSASIPPPLPQTHFCDGDPSLSFDSQGRLFWTYLGRLFGTGAIDIFVSQLNPSTGAVLPGYPVNITELIGMAASAGFCNDKEWLAIDGSSTSPFTDRMYISWTEFSAFDRPVLTSMSSDQGLTWAPAVKVSTSGEGFTWPSHSAVAPNGDLYVAYHSQTGFTGGPEAGGNPTGTSGKIFVLRSTNGGVSFPQKNLAYAQGQADITFNVQSATGTIPQTSFWTQGSAQPWVLPDPFTPGAVYVVANDDPNNVHGLGDDADVYIVRSFNNGLTWSAQTKINSGPFGFFEVMPTAAIDKVTGNILVSWYSNASSLLNSDGNFLLDLFFAISSDQGSTFTTQSQINDLPFDPDLGAPQRFPGPPPTLRIGEYIGAAIANDEAHFIWTGNTSVGQQVFTDSLLIGPPPPPPPPCNDLTGDGVVNAVDLAGLLSAWGLSGIADLNNDGVVNSIDLATLLVSWGPCP